MEESGGGKVKQNKGQTNSRPQKGGEKEERRDADRIRDHIPNNG